MLSSFRCRLLHKGYFEKAQIFQSLSVIQILPSSQSFVRSEAKIHCDKLSSVRTAATATASAASYDHKYSDVQARILNTDTPRRPNRLNLLENDAADSEVVCLLQQILNLDTPKKAEQIFIKYERFWNLNTDEIRSAQEFLEGKGVIWRHLQQMPWLLTLDSEAMELKVVELRARLQIQEFLTAAPLLQLPSIRVSRISFLWRKEIMELKNREVLHPKVRDKLFANRIEVLAVLLSCEAYEVSEMMRRTPLLLTSPLPLVEAKINCMLDYGIVATDIIKDPFIFTNVLESIESKLYLCKRHGLLNVKPWVLRCTPQAFKTFLDRTIQKSELLSGHEDITSFLAESLQCTTLKAVEIQARVPSVRKASAIKLNEMIQFLINKGFTTQDILEVPRILGHSVETIEKRMTDLNSHGFKLNSLFVVCYTSDHFDAFLRRLSKKKSTDT